MIIGLVGSPSSGKSTFFKASTLQEVDIANYPFTTIDKNEGVGHVRITCIEKEFNTKCNPRYGFCEKGQRFVPVRLIVVAGLVPGAHKGEGRGLEFLDDLRQADVLIQVIDASGSTNEKGEPVDAGSYDPLFDVKFLSMELDMWFLGLIKKGWDRFARKIQQEKSNINNALAKQLSGLNVTEDLIIEATNKLNLDPTTPVNWSEENLHELAIFLRKKTKPLVVAANKIDLPTAKENVERLKKEFADLVIVPCSAESELALREAARKQLIKYLPGDADFEIIGELNEKQKQALNFIKEKILNEWKNTGVQDCLNKAVFDFLNYIVIFPGAANNLADSKGNILPDCFLLKKGSTALDFAFKIHQDIGNKFSCAIDARSGKRLGRDYELKDHDVLKIMTN